MPWTLPTLKSIRMNTAAYVKAAVQAQSGQSPANPPPPAALIPNGVLRIVSDCTALLAHLVLQFIANLAKMILPTSAEDVWLDRWATLYLINADGSRGRKQATFAAGTVVVTVASPTGATISEGQMFAGGNRIAYEATSTASISIAGTVEVSVVAMTAGVVGNLDANTSIVLTNPPAGVSLDAAIVTMSGGTDTETDDQLRARLLFRLANPPMGGDAADYVIWALAVPGVTRAWCNPEELGIGTITVRFMCDTLRASNGGFPLQVDVDAVTAYIDTVRPVTVKDFFVVAPVPFPIDVTIQSLNPDNPTNWANIVDSLRTMLFEKGAPAFAAASTTPIYTGSSQPAQTIFVAWVSDAILSAPGVDSFDLVDNGDYVPTSNGSLAVLGDVIHG